VQEIQLQCLEPEEKALSVAQSIEEKLRAAFDPVSLAVIDESHQHAGHVGARPGGETHFRVEITAKIFADLNRVERQRRVYEVLQEELDGPVHALSVSASPS
jgi:BolA protein|tara:strand:- start:188 stop:493 length:306 start_codon:yes stop_codon:yes gene_type:complete